MVHSELSRDYKSEILMKCALAGLTLARVRGRVGVRPKGLTRKTKEFASLAAPPYLTKKYTTTNLSSAVN
jgi:hypothetical protein